MPWPNFIICGMKKAATTSLYEYLRQHPDIYMSPIKEPKYFLFDPEDSFFVDAPRSKYPVRTQEEYLAMFDGVRNERAIGEASPSYAISDRARQQILATIPNAKLIFSLRNPTDRLYSAYQMGVRGGAFTMSFDEYANSGSQHLSNFTYTRFLRPWIEDFDRARLKFVLAESLKHSVLDEVAQLYRFLDVDDTYVPARLKQHNPGGIPKNKQLNQVIHYLRKHPYKASLTAALPSVARTAFTRIYTGNLAKAPAMSQKTRSFLDDYFENDITELSELTGLDLSIWSQGVNDV